MKVYLDELTGSTSCEPQRVQPVRPYREGCTPTTLGAFSLDSIARGMGTDTKTLLLVGGAGLLAGYALNSLVRGTKRGFGKMRRKAKKAMTPQPKTITIPGHVFTAGKLAVLVIAAGGAWWMYERYRQSQALHAQLQLPGRRG